MKIDGRLFIVLTIVLALIPAVCAVSVGGGASVSTDGLGFLLKETLLRLPIKLLVIRWLKTEISMILRTIGSKTQTGKHVEVKANVKNAETLNYDYYLSLR